ncbi:hypothetical protein [Phenylobacterium sp.]|uniref:hypothetical protein n=1 Tax=Phenylobacterium sp. TaxID=1871053 RepID=UPI002724BFC4|nr:hypothetical protein [Phenylobacterium sp.]MDO8381019.1 hypothetical protein [Phenylobacterium sp.]
MRPPGIITRLVGNGLVMALLGVGVIVFGVQFFTTGEGGIPALACLGVGILSKRANDQLRSYQLWKMEWEAMGGEAPKGFSLPHIPGARYVLGGIVWLFFAQGALALGKAPGNELVIALFWLGSAIMAGVILFRVFRRFGALIAKGAKGKRVTVGVCLPAPRQSPALQEAYSALPEYCWGLFRQPAAVAQW